VSCASWSSSLPVPLLGPRGRKRARTPERSIRSGRGHRAGGVTPVEVRHRLRTSKPVTPASRRESWPQGQLVYDCTPIAGAYVTRPRKLARATRAGRSPSECWCTRETRRVREPVATLTRALSMLRFRIGRPLCARFGVWGRWTHRRRHVAPRILARGGGSSCRPSAPWIGGSPIGEHPSEAFAFSTETRSLMAHGVGDRGFVDRRHGRFEPAGPRTSARKL
jgi:hypothetical protein